MLPGDEQKGPSSNSELFDSLRIYLDNRNRLQPIIGLGSIIECVKADAHNKQVLYLCEVCICRLSKSDMRNHIMGSLHRYNYIKSRYPHLVSGWEESSDLSKLARPLMDMAKVLEGKEGPGDVQLIEVEDDIYQKTATHSESDAIILISSLRGEPESDPETSPGQSQRIVLLAKPPQTPSEKSFKAGMRSLKTKHQMLSELSRLSGRSSCYFKGYTGTKPLIGLCRVVECKNEDGQTCGFLCHCCRTRAKRRGITDHLTSSSHLFNYLMETHPEKVKFVTAAGDDSIEFLQSLAEKVEEDEGRGNPKVVTAPESICNRMEKKSYNWCVRMLCTASVSTNQQQKVAFKGPKVNTTSVQDSPHIRNVPSDWAHPMTWRKKSKKKMADTVFNVSLPCTSGAVLLERTSFSKDRLSLSCTFSASSDPAVDPPAQSQTEQSNLDHGSKLFVVNNTDRASQLQQGDYNNEGGACQHVGQEENFTVSVPQGVDNYFRVNKREPYDPCYPCEEGYVEQCYNAEAQSKTGTEVQESSESRQMEISSDAAWHHYQQPQYMGPDYANPSVGHHGSSEELVPHVDATRIGTYPYFGYSYPHCASAAPEPHIQFHEIGQRQMQTYTEFTGDHVHIAPHNFMTQPVIYQAVQFGHGFMVDPSYNIRPRMNDNQLFPHPVSGGNGFGAMYQPNAYVPPWQAPCYGVLSNVTVRATGLSGVMSSGGDTGTVQLTQ